MHKPIECLSSLPSEGVFYEKYWNKKAFLVKAGIDKQVLGQLIEADELAEDIDLPHVCVLVLDCVLLRAHLRHRSGGGTGAAHRSQGGMWIESGRVCVVCVVCVCV